MSRRVALGALAIPFGEATVLLLGVIVIEAAVVAVAAAVPSQTEINEFVY